MLIHLTLHPTRSDLFSMRNMSLRKHLMAGCCCSCSSSQPTRFRHLARVLLGARQLSGGGAAAGELGVQRRVVKGLSEKQAPLAGTVQTYDRHVFLCYKTPLLWPSRFEAAESDRLPWLLSKVMWARKAEMCKRTRLTICGGEDNMESSKGDVLIFPDMIRYRQLTESDIDKFVEEALVNDREWLPGGAETLPGSYIFVCSHGSRDQRCGFSGPAIIEKFNEEIKSRCLQGQVTVNPCSHIGGHRYAGNVIIYNPGVDGKVSGHWYGYVGPDDIPVLLDQHIGKGEVIPDLWRGQMGLTQEEQKKVHTRQLQMNREKHRK